MIQVELAKPEMIEVPVGKVGAHDEVPRNLPLDAQIDVERGPTRNVNGTQAARGLLGQLVEEAGSPRAAQSFPREPATRSAPTPGRSSSIVCALGLSRLRPVLARAARARIDRS